MSLLFGPLHMLLLLGKMPFVPSLLEDAPVHLSLRLRDPETLNVGRTFLSAAPPLFLSSGTLDCNCHLNNCVAQNYKLGIKSGLT